MNTKIKVKSGSKISKLLNQCKVKKGEKCNYTRMNPNRSYYIPNELSDKFFEYYEKAIEKNTKLSLIERHTEFGPMVIDIDLKFDSTDINRKYTIDHIEAIISAYLSEIEEAFEIEDETKYDVFVFERNHPYLEKKKDKTIVKDGIHIMFPYIISKPNIQLYIRDNILKKCSDLFSDINVINSTADIFDRSVISSNGWFLYKSVKPNKDPYLLTHIFDNKIQEKSIEDYDYGGDSIYKFLSIRRNDPKDLIPVKQEIEEKMSKSKKYKKKHKKYPKNVYKLDEVQKLVDILSPSRADEYSQWLEVGLCLHYIDKNNSELLNAWIKFSKQSTKYEKGCCKKNWEKFADSGSDGALTLASLHYWAKLDNNDAYMEIRRQDLYSYIEKSLYCTNWDIANVLYQMYKHQYVCANGSKKIWYEYKEHRWIKLTDNISLRKRISSTSDKDSLAYEYCNYISHYNELSSDEALEEEEREEYRKKSEKFLEIVQKLKTTSFKDCIMKECIELFYNSSFEENLDENPYLIGFNNGVYDLQRMTFREGRPDDYITLCTNNDYIDYCEDDENIEEINMFMSQIFPDEEIRNYILVMLASHLQGLNEEEKFRFWTGTGGNGKSKLEELFINSFGDYTVKFNISLLTQKRAASNSANPEIMRSKGKRFAYLEESNENDKINIGLLKEFTGGDKITARGLYAEPIDFKPQFKMLLLCNKLPKVPADDNGLWRRLEVTEFKSRFVDNPVEENEFKKDGKLSEKLVNWKETFISMLINVYYRIYKKEGINVPEEVTSFTKMYQKNSDIYSEFIFDNLTKTGEKDDIIGINEIYDEFRIWYQQNYNSNKVPVKRELKNYLEKKFGKKHVTSRKLIGFRMRDDDELI